MPPRFFRSAAAFRAWLDKNHASRTELWVGFWKKSSGRAGMVYAEALDEALCFGWIDGLVRGLDEASYMQRFTPRSPRSTWSRVNVAKFEALRKAGRVAPAGLAAFEARDPERTGLYSFEQGELELTGDQTKAMKADRRAWAYWRGATPAYRKAATWWIRSAKKEETRERRLAALVACSARGRRVPPFVERKGPPSARAAAVKRLAGRTLK
ncbi:MAG TPA: YdeI/OmpD-associated family protein [Candidatus Thermoplasmatota archaeon]|nr:YdeI/OmpD-associated family protein [Candidatus Thermoplasmatota archaeon]